MHQIPFYSSAHFDERGRVEKASGGGTKWIQGAVKHPGAFTASANKAGKSVHEYAEEKKHASGTLGRRARLALTFEGMHKK